MMTTAAFTQADLDKINGTIKPKCIRTLVVCSSGALAFCFLLPFMPGRYGRLSPYLEGTYWHAFVFYLIFFGALTMLLYYRFIMSINQDLRDGEKIVARLPVKIRKKLLLDPRFELMFEKGRLLHKPKITLPNTEFDQWKPGDLVDLEILYKSGEILNYKKVTE